MACDNLLAVFAMFTQEPSEPPFSLKKKITV